MIVCSCNVLSDTEILETLSREPARPNVAAVFRRMGCEAKCGRCIRTIRGLVSQEAACAATLEDSALDSASIAA